MKLPRSFFDRPTLDIACDLLGMVLVHNRRNVLTSGVIVEVEAYIGESDPACHAAAGPTRRNAPLYGAPGYAYVYLNYGIHSLVNVVTEPLGSPAAVLIRALNPLDGVAAMRRRRGRAGLRQHDLCRGPGNLTRAMGITLAENQIDLLGERLYIEDRGLRIAPFDELKAPRACRGPDSDSHSGMRVAWGPRIGIRVATERPWRAWVQGHPAVSRAAPAGRSGRR